MPDELLSSWLVRLAHGHGLKVQTFCNLIFGNRHQVWNRDIDRLAPEWLLDELSCRTGTPLEIAHATTLRAYEGRLYPRFKASGSLQWIQTLKMYHRKFEGFGLQYCPMCLRDGPVTYYRKSWRVAYNTVCVQHRCMLCDRCPNCGAGVAFHRGDMGRTKIGSVETLVGCHQCGADLSERVVEPINSYDVKSTAWHLGLCQQLIQPDSAQWVLERDSLGVMRQLAMLLTSRSPTVKLHAHVCEQLKAPIVQLTTGRIATETRPLHERHHLIQLIAWLMVDLEPRLRKAWSAKAVRYNHLGKGFVDAPKSYLNVIEGFADWRHK